MEEINKDLKKIECDSLIDDSDEILRNTLNKINESRKERIYEDVSKYGVAIEASDWMYWNIYDLNSSIGVSLEQINKILDYFVKKDSVIYGYMLNKIELFCKDCACDCSRCRLKDFVKYLHRKTGLEDY